MRVRFRSSSAVSSSRGSATRRGATRIFRVQVCGLLALAMGFSGCSRRPNVFDESRDSRLLRLEEERADLARTDDAVDRTRIQIRISDLMISFMGDAATDGDMERIEARLTEYRSAIVDARNTMMGSGRDPTRDVAGYRDLEIALRQQIRRLDDIGTSLTLAFREPIEGLIVEMTEIRNELLDALFPPPGPA